MSAARVKILFVEDNTGDAWLTQELLRETEYVDAVRHIDSTRKEALTMNRWRAR